MKKIGDLLAVFTAILFLSIGCGCIGDVPNGEPVSVVNESLDEVQQARWDSLNVTEVKTEAKTEVCPIYEERDITETQGVFEAQEVFETQPVYESQPIYETRYNIVASIHEILSTKVIKREDLTREEAIEFLKQVELATAIWETNTIDKTSYEKIVDYEDVLVGHKDVLVGHEEVLIGFEEVVIGTEFAVVGYEEVPLGTCKRKEGVASTDDAQVRWEKQEIEDEDSIYPDFIEPEPTPIPVVEETRNVHITVDYVAKVLFVKKSGDYKYDWYDAPKSDADIEKAVWKKVGEVADEYHAKVVSVDIKIEDF